MIMRFVLLLFTYYFIVYSNCLLWPVRQKLVFTSNNIISKTIKLIKNNDLHNKLWNITNNIFNSLNNIEKTEILSI